VVIAANLRLAKNAFADKHECEKSNAAEMGVNKTAKPAE